MKFIVCIKQVPDPKTVRFDEEKGTLIREGVQSAINPYDLNALEEALSLKNKLNAEVVTLSMGPPQATESIKQTIAMGADSGVLLSDRKFAGSDTLATTYILSNAIKKLESFDIIFCGKQTVDGDTAQVGPGLAARLGIPSITFVRKIEISEDGFFILHREMEDHIYVVKAKPPFLVTVCDSANTPRLETLRGKMKANKANIPLWDNNFLEGNVEMIGLDGSPTRVAGASIPPKKTQKVMLEGDDSQRVDFMINLLREKALL